MTQESIAKKALSEWQEELAEKDKRIAELEEKLANADYQLEGRDLEIKELEKENAELKEKVNILDNCDRLGDVITEAYKDQLAKAKELLKEFVHHYKAKTIYIEKMQDLLEQAEQFIKDSEVEKCGQ